MCKRAVHITGFPASILGTRNGTPGNTLGRTPLWRTHPASDGANCGPVNRSGLSEPASERRLATMAVALPPRLHLCGAGAAYWSIPKARTLGHGSDCTSPRAMADGLWPTIKVAGRAALSKGDTGTMRASRLGSMPSDAICRLCNGAGAPPVFRNGLSTSTGWHTASAPGNWRSRVAERIAPPGYTRRNRSATF